MRFVISDIHGYNKTFHALLEQIQLTGSDTLYLLGDYIDRGPDSKGVLDTIMGMSRQTVSLRGNHEELMLHALENAGGWGLGSSDYSTWMVNGGDATLRSFGKTDVRPYLAFIRKLRCYIELDDFLLVHAGFDLSLSDPFGKMGEVAMLWSRNQTYHGVKPVICGHTPEMLEQIEAGLQTNKIDIDNGCYMNKTGYHHLVALCLDNRRLYIQENIDEEAEND